MDAADFEDRIMRINTSRFGELDVDGSRVLTFPKGLLGFPAYQRYVLLEAGRDSYFYWLQSVDQPDLAFVVTDPSTFVPTYRIPLRGEQLEEIGIESLAEAQVFVIVNKRGHLLTGNLQGPLVIDVRSCTGKQLVLSDRRFTTRVPLVELGAPLHAASA